MDMRPSSHFMREIAEESWSKYTQRVERFYTIIFQGMPKSESLKKVGCLSSLLICPSMTKKQKDSLQDWKDAWRGLYKWNQRKWHRR